MQCGSLASKEWLNPRLHIVELISIKRYLNHCLHCGASYYQFFACLPFNKAFITFSFIILTKNLWIENDGLELWKNWLNFPALFVMHTKFWLGFGAQNTWTLNLAFSSTSSSSSSWSRFLLLFFFGFENFWSSWIYYFVSEGLVKVTTLGFSSGHGSWEQQQRVGRENNRRSKNSPLIQGRAICWNVVTNLPHVIRSIFAQTIHALFEGNVSACVRACVLCLFGDLLLQTSKDLFVGLICSRRRWQQRQLLHLQRITTFHGWRSTGHIEWVTLWATRMWWQDYRS